jgi:hypothetical protein
MVQPSSKRWAAGVVLCALVILAGAPGQAAAQTTGGTRVVRASGAASLPVSASLERSRKLVGGNQTLIARFMYPASTLDCIEETGTNPLSRGEFELVYKFHFKAATLWSAFYAEQVFRFDGDGRLLSSRNGKHNTTWAPGTVAELFLDAARGIAMTMLPKTGDSGGTQVLIALIEQARARDVLEFILRARE